MGGNVAVSLSKVGLIGDWKLQGAAVPSGPQGPVVTHSAAGVEAQQENGMPVHTSMVVAGSLVQVLLLDRENGRHVSSLAAFC